MKKYKSTYQKLMEELGDSIITLSEQDNFELVSNLNREMSASIYIEKIKEAEAERELAQIHLTA